MTSIELLSPAKNLQCGIAAIDHGADAVYIGAPLFGARSAAANSINDIAELVQYAHTFHAKVYVALNTILFDNEIEQAVKIAHDIYTIGADALIIQDLGLLECNLPPIPIHASTQLNNKSAEKVQFLEQVGFSQVVLARELSVEQISSIRSQTEVALECFVHGALCVSYSGQCYMSAFATGRSGNRGECSQMCRHAYTVEGLQMPTNKKAYYLSPKDVSLQNYIGAMIDAGVQSFKIEGRLKDENYVKNCTAYYRKKIDAEIAKRPHTQRASHGYEIIGFTPDVTKTFSRQFTDYYIAKKQNNIANFNSPKSQGEYLGTILRIQGNRIEITTTQQLHNGDGLCYMSSNGDLQGVRINTVHGNSIELAEPIQAIEGTAMWRNVSVQFLKQLEQSNTCRYIRANIVFTETDKGYSLTITDENRYTASIFRTFEKHVAKQAEKVRQTIEQQLKKTGQSIFRVSEITITWNTPFFIPISEINEARRLLVEALQNTRIQKYTRDEKCIIPNEIPYPCNEPTDVRLNISNRYAQQFFNRHGIHTVQQAFELQANTQIPLMTTKYCIRYECGECPKHAKHSGEALPIYLKDNTHRYRVEFNCKKCEMHIFFDADN